MNQPMTTEPDAPPAVSRTALTIGLCAVIIGIAFEAAAVATAMPVAARELHGLGQYAWAFSLFTIGMLFSTVVSGRLCDRIGPAKPMIAGVIIFALGLVIGGTAVSWPMLILGRLVQGLGGGALNTASYVCIAQVFDAKQRPRMFTYISMAWVLPGIAGPVVAAWITHTFSWHWAFFAVLPVLAFGAAMLTPTLRLLLRSPVPHPEQATNPAPIWGAAVAALSAAAIQYAGQRLDLIAIIPAVIGVVGLAIALPRLMPPGFARLSRGLPSVILTRMLLPGAFFGTEAFVPLMLVEERHLSLKLAGAALTIGSIGWFAGAWVQSQSWMRMRRDRMITVGTAGVAIGVAIVAASALVPGSWIGLVAVGWIFAAFGMGVGTASSSVATMAFSTDAEQGRNASSLNLGDALGTSIFVGISGSVFAALRAGGDLSHTFGVAFATMTVVALLSVIASLRVGRLPH
ncbi:MFS transporter [Microlunatus elymi]|uniref:MFS transporter n=1 Tax=Microlunatus elymi TaxID=2596828 RepID=A0A516PX65_9ACTN|nr:MFS transporter [Microlunatus elymi]QDP95775.1 MFS transporter [Microlunatus elymi]